MFIQLSSCIRPIMLYQISMIITNIVYPHYWSHIKMNLTVSTRGTAVSTNPLHQTIQTNNLTSYHRILSKILQRNSLLLEELFMCLITCSRKIILPVPENCCLKKALVLLFSSSRQITELSQTGRHYASQTLGKGAVIKNYGEGYPQL
jgi:hypothetical protein